VSSWGDSWANVWGNSWGQREVEQQPVLAGGYPSFDHVKLKREDEEILLIVNAFLTMRQNDE